MNKLFKVIISSLVLIQILNSSEKNTVDLKVVNAKLLYDQTLKNGDVVQKLYTRSIDGDNWSVLRNMTLDITIKNEGKNEAIGVNVITELYYLLKEKIDSKGYPSINAKALNNIELKDIIMKKGVWVWNRRLGGEAKLSLLKGESFQHTFKNLNLSTPYHAQDYTISGFAIRVFTYSSKQDVDMTNNTKDFIFEFSM